MTGDTTHQLLSFDEFRNLVARELETDPALVTADASFLDDLQADSIQLVDLLLRFEGQGIAIPLEAAWQIRTVHDAYQVYVQSLAPLAPLPAHP